MDSREKILAALQSQLKPLPLEEVPIESGISDPIQSFKEVLVAIGGAVIEVEGLAGVVDYVTSYYRPDCRIFNAIPGLPINSYDGFRTRFSDAQLVILQGKFGVGENGAVWITDEAMPDRVLPFITEHLILIINKNEIVATLTEAYNKIGSDMYQFGTFIAGPSKTADIEQSLVLGAHGPKSMTVVLLGT